MPKNRMPRGLAALSASAITAIYAAGYVRTQAADAELGAAENTTAPVEATSVTTQQSAPTTVLVLPLGRGAGGSSQQTATPSLAAATPPTSAVAQTTPTAALATSPPQEADAGLGATESATTVPVVAAVPATQQSAPTPVAVLPRSRGGADSASPPPTPSLPPVTRAAPPVARTTPTPAPAKSPASAYKDGTYTGVGQSRRGGVQVSLTVQGGRIASVTITRVSTEYPASDIAPLPREVVTRQSAQVDMVSGATYSSIAFRGAVQQALSQAQA